VGFLRPGVIVAAAFNGYGGSYCCASGQVAASLATSGQAPDWLPDDVFSRVWGQEWYIRVRPEPVGLGDGTREPGLVVTPDGELAGGVAPEGAVR